VGITNGLAYCRSIITYHYGADNYVPWPDVTKGYPWAADKYAEWDFDELMKHMRPRFKLRDIPMGGDLLVEDRG
jgi:hypothetical protein